MKIPVQWRYLRSGYGSKNADFDIVNERGGRIASTPYEDKARTIAAVPTMLAALEVVIAQTFDAAVNGHLGAPALTPEAVARIYDAARAALIEAKGTA